MVVPMTDCTKRIVCEGKKIFLRTNSDSLLVVGCGNLIMCDNNEGVIRIVGDGCRISVGKGCGRIEYKGDGGHVESGSDLSNIKYVGDGGRIVQTNSKFQNTTMNNSPIISGKLRMFTCPVDVTKVKIIRRKTK